MNRLPRFLSHLAMFLVLSAAAVGLAYARGRARLALAVGVILLGASATTEVLTISIADGSAAILSRSGPAARIAS